MRGAGMLADAPPWMQDWARSRHDKARSVGSMTTGLGEIPAYLLSKTNGGTSLADRLARALSGTYDEAEVRSSLAFIPATERDDWLRVGMAIHEAGWGERGFAIWSEWSRTVPEKYNEHDQAKTWESFNRPSRNGQSVTLATVFHMAIERGWRAGNSAALQIQNQQSDNANTMALNNDQGKNSEPSDLDREIARLAKLNRVQYDHEPGRGRLS
jgi:hypothetical protein